MPKMTKLPNSTILVTITEEEVINLRVESNMTETSGQIIQDLLTQTMGLEESDQYWISDIRGALDAMWDEEKREWRYVYNPRAKDELIFN